MNNYAFVSMNGSKENLAGLVQSDVLAFDVEATGLNVGTAVPIGFSLANMPNAGYYTDINNDFFRQLLADKDRLYIAFNARYDRSMMKKAGVVIDNLCDPMIAAHLLEEAKVSLKALVSEYFDVDLVAYQDLGKSLTSMNMDEITKYSAPHSFILIPLWYKLNERMKKLNLRKVFWNIEMPLVPVVSDMELNGIMVDSDILIKLGGELDRRIEILEEAMDYHSGCSNVNYNSPTQVADVLYRKLCLPAPYGGGVRAKYLKEKLRKLHPFVGLYLMFKELKTLKHSYVSSLRKDIINGRIYASFNQMGTRTSRFSSSGPNLQKIPVRTYLGNLIRTAFIAPEGYSFVKPDWDQLELRMLAHCSKDPYLIDAFRSGKDIHEETAIRAYRSRSRRRDGKTLNYQVVFGGGSMLARKMFFAAYPVAGEWINNAIREAREALCAYTLGGRRRYIPELDSVSGKIASHGGREAISTIIQGSSAEEVKKGMVRIWKVIKDTCVKMLLQVHDELVFEVPDKYVPDLVEVIQNTLPTNELEVPLTVSIEVGKNWGQMKKIVKGSNSGY